MAEQNKATAQEILVTFGARFNAEAVSIGDMIHGAVGEMQQEISALRQRVAELEAGAPKE